MYLLQPAALPPLEEPYVAPSAEVVERGRYLAAAANCFSCHTQDGGEAFAGGVAFETPFGTIHSPNITPDVATGIGSWSPEAFRRAMHEGIAADGAWLFPAFPYTSYTRLSDADVDAIYAWLRTVEPVSYSPPENGLLFTQRWPLAIWNALFFEPGRFTPDATQTDEWNRGAYLVEGAGHCGACHTPRNRLMAEIAERAYEGGVIHERGTDGKLRAWSAVNLTSAKSGLAAWSVRDLVQYFQAGYSLRAGTFGPMNEVIVNSLMKLTPADAQAMAVYLKSLPPAGEDTASIPPALVAAGEAIYEDQCEECHSSSGRGGIFGGPPLAGSAIVQDENPASLLNIVLFGPETPAEISFGVWETMRGHGDALNDAEIAALANYIRGSWGNVGTEVTAADVARQR